MNTASNTSCRKKKPSTEPGRRLNPKKPNVGKHFCPLLDLRGLCLARNEVVNVTPLFLLRNSCPKILERRMFAVNLQNYADC